MRGGARMTKNEREKQDHLAGAGAGAASGVTPQRSPVEQPPFTLGQLRKAIPPHCFERSVLRSFSYVLHDLAIAAALLYFALVAIPALPAGPLRFAAWPLYWLAQGCVCTGLWVIGHECGHNAFSAYPLLDDAVGLVLHSSLLVPYFSWKHSHRRHHSNIGSLERDEVFVPRTKDALPWHAPYLCRSAAGRLLQIAAQLAVGWPLYLAANASGRAYPRFACHFDPFGPIFGDRERAQVVVSDAGVAAVALALWKVAAARGLWLVARVYGAPLMVVNAWLVLVTFLQHTHPALPRYGAGEWDWLRGALATVDRDYGGVLSRVFHHITDTHVAHHLFSTVPHYHAVEATRAIRPVLGEYYRFDPTPIARATWREARECVYVEPENGRGIFWYNKF